MYEVFNRAGKTGPSVLIAVTKMKGARKLEENRVAFAGMVKEMEVKRARKTKAFYLETIFYAPGSN